MFKLSALFDIGRAIYGELSYRGSSSGKILPPLRVIIEPTYRCNCRCPFCYVEDHTNRGELTTKEWLSIIEQIPRWAFISFEGGEVTLRSDIMELLKACKKRVWGKVNMLTNGTNLSPKDIENIVDNAPLVVSISLDGLRDTHDRWRGYGKFDRAWATLEYLSELRKYHWPHLPLLDVKLVLLPENLDEVPELFARCGKLGIDFFSISLRNDHHLKQNAYLRSALDEEFTTDRYPLQPYLDIDRLRVMMQKLQIERSRFDTEIRWSPKIPNRSAFRQLIWGIKSACCGCKPALSNSDKAIWKGSEGEREYAKIVDLLRSGDRPVSELYEFCKFPFANIFINPQGDVYPCLSVRWGNLREQSFREIYNGENAKAFRRALRAKGVFNGCQLCCESILKI